MTKIDSVAVIGAGPCGLATAKYLLAENAFSKVQLFEQRELAGGIWNHTSLNVVDTDFCIPRTEPTTLPDTPVRVEGKAAAQFVSPVYDCLETNIPYSLMNYSDTPFPPNTSLFPSHSVVLKYLHQYAEELNSIAIYSTQVLSTKKVFHESRPNWQVNFLDINTGVESTSYFDAVVVASGHYNDPYIPDIPGLDAFNRIHPGSVSHSKFYRNPAQFKGMKVVIVGNSASGIDLSAQISAVCQHPVIVSEKTIPNTPVEERSWSKKEPEIVEFVPEGRTLRFANGDTESGVDAVVFCTGYFYSYPFLSELPPLSPVTADGSHVANLYESVLYIDDPSLAFVGIPQRVVPFPIAEVQAAWVSRIWAGRLPVPSKEIMCTWLQKKIEEAGPGKTLHNMGFPNDVSYINKLHDWSRGATPRLGLSNDGKGKEPPYWNDEKAWVRKSFPEIKIASRKLRDSKLDVTSLEALGFDYKVWKASQVSVEAASSA